MNKWKGDNINIEAGTIISLVGVIIAVLGVIWGIAKGYHLIQPIIMIVGGVINISLGFILLELESHNELFIAYVEDFVKPYAGKKLKKTKK